MDIAEGALYDFGRYPKRFVFKNRGLKINRCNKSRQQTKATVANQLPGAKASTTAYFDIFNVHYGTFIMGAAMNNITGINEANDFGLVAHRLINNERNIRIHLRIDQQEKKFSILVSYESLNMMDSTVTLTFEWTFSA